MGKKKTARPAKGSPFKLVSDYKPTGDQPQAIEALVEGLEREERFQVLLGVTGSGKTFTMANVIARVGLPTLVLSPNKTLAAQLYGEFRRLFPENAVEYFVSYYDYYQPEAYIPSTDTYIEKDANINDEIDRMRHSATRSLLTRNDVIIVASISCIYGLGSAEAYNDMLVFLEVGRRADRDEVLAKLVEIQYERNDTDFHRGTFRVRGDTVEIFPAHEECTAVRVEFFGDEVEHLSEIDPLRGRRIRDLAKAAVYPASHYAVDANRRARAITAIRAELALRLAFLREDGRLVEAQRLEQRTMYDLEMLEQIGFCSGIENYSRHLSGRQAGEPPPTLLDYFPRRFLMFIDESHVAVPQAGGMYRGDRSRKETLVEYGFRLPSALDNRPLRFEEFEGRMSQTVFVSATPADYEIGKTRGVVAEQIIRPTGLTDPVVEVRPAANQVDELLDLIRARVAGGDRVLVTTLTKRMAEELTEYYAGLGVRVRYLHSEIDTLERTAILRDLSECEFDELVGINLLREGLDLPEVSLVAILDADHEGYLRSTRSLIQTMGRAARNVRGTAVLFADRITGSIRTALDETARRRRVQEEYNREHGITPRTIEKNLSDETFARVMADYTVPGFGAAPQADLPPLDQIPRRIGELTREMRRLAAALEFERAAAVRDRIQELRRRELALGGQ